MRVDQFIKQKIAISLAALVGWLVPVAAHAVDLSVESGNVQAEYFSQPDPQLTYCETNHRLRIRREGQVYVDQEIDAEIGICRSHEQGLKVEDLDGDREPEVILDLFSGGAHCCGFSYIYGYDATSEQYTPTLQFWGHTDQSNLEDLNGDGVIEFVSFDSRFAYRFASFARSGLPIQIWQYRQGEMVNATRNFPEQVYNDAYYYWQQYTREQAQGEGVGEVKGYLAAYLADKYLLGQAEDGWQRVRQVYQASDRQEYFANLLNFLQDTGYTSQTASSSETDDPLQAATTAQVLLTPSQQAGWYAVSGTNDPNARAEESDFWYVKLDTIARSGDAINFDVIANREYVRYSANCQTRLMSRIRQAPIDRNGQFVPEIVQEEFFPADNSVQRGLVLDYACAQE